MAAAARFILQRRLGSVIHLDRARFNNPFFSTGLKLINTIASPPTHPPNDDGSNPPDSNPPRNPLQNPIKNEPKLTYNYNVSSTLKSSSRHDMAMVFTCKVCETRSVKTACRESYETGVVVARCPGCDNLHLIADRLGWFGKPGSVEDFLAQRGEEVKRGNVDTMNFTLEDLAGSDKS